MRAADGARDNGEEPLTEKIMWICLIVSTAGIVRLLLSRASERRERAAQAQQLAESLRTELSHVRMETANSIKHAVDSQNRILQGEALESERRLENIRRTMESRLNRIQDDNSQKLERMREMVEQKLQTTLENRISDSFKLVNDRLEQVYKGLGEMQSLAVGVGDLKKILSNVKTRGMLGELQLGAILEEILSPEQYEQNVMTKKGSRSFVEYAIKLPADGDTVYLPIDAKFPSDAYGKLLDAYDGGDAELIRGAKK